MTDHTHPDDNDLAIDIAFNRMILASLEDDEDTYERALADLNCQACQQDLLMAAVHAVAGALEDTHGHNGAVTITAARLAHALDHLHSDGDA